MKNQVAENEVFTLEIIEGLIEKGGLYGSIAKIYKPDYYKSRRFILEISEQCRASAIPAEIYGKELVQRIARFRTRFGDN